MSLCKSLILIFWINIHQLRWYQSLCTVFCLSSKTIWSSDSISVWLHAMKKFHCLHQLKFRKVQRHFTLFSFPPEYEQKSFPDSALEARTGLEKDFLLFFGGNVKTEISFWNFLTFTRPNHYLNYMFYRYSILADPCTCSILSMLAKHFLLQQSLFP